MTNEKVKGQIVDKSLLVPNDVVEVGKDMWRIPSGEYLVLGSWLNGDLLLLGKLKSTNQYLGFLRLVVRFGRSIQTDNLEGLVKEIGASLAAIIKQNNLPKGFLKKLSTEELLSVYCCQLTSDKLRSRIRKIYPAAEGYSSSGFVIVSSEEGRVLG